jgi:hypothetical protein
MTQNRLPEPVGLEQFLREAEKALGSERLPRKPLPDTPAEAERQRNLLKSLDQIEQQLRRKASKE